MLSQMYAISHIFHITFDSAVENKSFSLYSVLSHFLILYIVSRPLQAKELDNKMIIYCSGPKRKNMLFSK